MQCGACHLHYRFTETPEGVHRANPDVDILPAMKGSTKSPKCQRKPCTKNANGLCKKNCCRFCCVVLGGSGCPAKDHELASLSIAKQKKALNLRSSIPGQFYSAQTTPSSSRISPTPTFDALAKVLRDQDPVIQLQHEDLLRVQAEQHQADQELAQELQEEEEHQAMLASARAALRSSPTHSSPTFPPLRSSSSSHALHLDPLSTSAPKNHGDDSATFFVAGLPVTRVGSSNQPKKTTQMNETWMREYEDHTKEVQKRKGKGQIDLEMVQKFRVVWWEQV